MQVIFLDIDGVLYTKRSGLAFAQAIEQRRATPCDDERVKAFDVEAVKNLGELVYLTGARLVVSSTWRLRADLHALRDLFRNLPFAHALLDTTGTQRKTRAEEILAWLLSHPGITSFAIIDDMLDGLDVTFPDHFVKCEAGRGFGDRAAFDLALSILHRTDGGTPHV